MVRNRNRLNRQGEAARSRLHALYANMLSAFEPVQQMLQPVNCPQEWLQNMPRDIQTLRALANQDAPKAPEFLNELFRSLGHENLIFPCQAAGGLASRLAAMTELQRRIDSASGTSSLMGDMKADVAHSLVKCLRYLFLAVCLQNIYAIATTVMDNNSDNSRTLMLVTREVVAIIIHYSLANRLANDDRLLTGIENENSLQLQDTPPAALQQRFQNRLGALKAQSEGFRNYLLQDLPQFLIGMLTLAVANSVLIAAVR